MSFTASEKHVNHPLGRRVVVGDPFPFYSSSWYYLILYSPLLQLRRSNRTIGGNLANKAHSLCRFEVLLNMKTRCSLSMNICGGFSDKLARKVKERRSRGALKEEEEINIV